MLWEYFVKKKTFLSQVRVQRDRDKIGCEKYAAAEYIGKTEIENI